MKTPSSSRRVLTRLVFSLVSVFALAALASPASAKGKFTCTIADPGPIDPGTPVTFTGTLSGGKPPYTVEWTFPNGTPETKTSEPGAVGEGETQATTTFGVGPVEPVVLTATETGGSGKAKSCSTSFAFTFGRPVARGDTYATPAGKQLRVQLSRVSGVLYNDFDTDETTGENLGNGGLTAIKVDDPQHGSADRNH